MRRRLLLLLALAVGCPAPGLYMVELPGEPCARATRLAYRSMTELGWTVTNVVEATPASAGKVEAVRATPGGGEERASVRIQCGAAGVRMQPAEGALVPTDYEFSRAFGYSVKTLAKQPDTQAPTEASGLEVLLERIDGPRARVELGGPVLAADAVLVRVTVRNHSDRAVIVEGGRITLVGDQGEAAGPLVGGALAAAIGAGAAANDVRGRLLARETVSAGDTAERFLVFPPGAWADGQVAIEDPETGESDGFVVPLQ